jgi:hypothetical protein
VIAYNLANLRRELALPKKLENWALTNFSNGRCKTGGRMVKHARDYWLLLAESHLMKRLFGSMLQRIAGLSLLAGQPRLRESENRSRPTTEVGVPDQTRWGSRDQQSGLALAQFGPCPKARGPSGK